MRASCGLAGALSSMLIDVSGATTPPEPEPGASPAPALACVCIYVLTQHQRQITDQRDGATSLRAERQRCVVPFSVHSLVIEKKIPPMALCAFTALLLRRKYVLWRCALVCERLRCEPWRPWGWGETTPGPRRPSRRGSQLLAQLFTPDSQAAGAWASHHRHPT